MLLRQFDVGWFLSRLSAGRDDPQLIFESCFGEFQSVAQISQFEDVGFSFGKSVLQLGYRLSELIRVLLVELHALKILLYARVAVLLN